MKVNITVRKEYEFKDLTSPKELTTMDCPFIEQDVCDNLYCMFDVFDTDYCHGLYKKGCPIKEIEKVMEGEATKEKNCLNCLYYPNTAPCDSCYGYSNYNEGR